MPVRPCHERHPDPTATAGQCRLCLLATVDPRYKSLWMETPKYTEGHPIRSVRFCRARNVWDWSVNVNGVSVGNGSEATEADAQKEAELTSQFFARVGDEKPVVNPSASQSKNITRNSLAFGHHGDHGDIVYSLRTVKQLCDESNCKVDFALYPRVGTRMLMTKDHADLLLPLLRVQSYISSADWSLYAHGIRLDAARRFAYRNTEASRNISEQYRSWMQLPEVDERKPWLRVDRVERVASVVFNRTPRYRPPSFPWRRIADTHKGNAVFIGNQTEYDLFCREVSTDIPYYRTKDFLEVARVIAGCDLFVGNQSCPRAIAEGLKVAVVVEEAVNIPDTHFNRPGAWYGNSDTFWTAIIQHPKAARARASYKDYDAQ